MNMDFENQSLANRPIPQAPAARPIPTHGQEIPPDWRSQHPVLQAILSFAQPILLRLVERKNVRLSVTRHQDQTSWNFSFAAMLVIGKKANGLTSWKTHDGKTLKSLETN